MHRVSVALISLWLGGVVLPLQAQDVNIPAEVDSLARVRLVRAGTVSETLVGQIVRADPEQITLRYWDGESIVPTSDIRRVDVSLGSPPIGVRRGALQGFAAGVVIVGVSALLGSASECEDCMFDITEAAVKGAVPITVVLTGAGALTGLLPGKERWRSVPLPLKIRSSTSPPSNEPRAERGLQGTPPA